MIKWTSVKDGLPDHDCSCLVIVRPAVRGCPSYESLAFFNHKSNEFSRDYQRWNPITHWAEITYPEDES